MLKLQSNLRGFKVVSFQEEQVLGTFEDLLINPEKGQVIAAVVTLGGFFKAQEKLVVLTDILEISSALFIQGADSLIDYSDLPRYRDLSYFSLLRLPVVSVSGKHLGRLADYSFDTLSGRLLKLYLQSGLWQIESRLIPADQIVSIDPKKIIVRDEALTVTEKETELESVPSLEQEPSSLKQVN